MKRAAYKSLRDYPTLKGDSRLQAKRLLIYGELPRECGVSIFLFTLPVCKVEICNKNPPTYAEPSPIGRENVWTPALEE